MASFASSATTCGARKHAWTKISLTKKYIGKKNLTNKKFIVKFFGQNFFIDFFGPQKMLSTNFG